MTNKQKFIPAVIAAAFLALCLPALAAAQGSSDPWGRPVYQNDRDYRRDQDRDYRRDRNRNRDYDNGSYDNSNYGRYDSRTVRDSVHRLKDLSERFSDDLDRALDHSREDGSRHEDHLNADAKEFRRATNDLKNRLGNGRDLSRSENEAQRVLEIGSHLEHVTEHHFNDNRLASDWSEISQELRVVANAYGLSYSGYNNGGYNNGDYRNGDYRRNDGSYGRDDDYRRRNQNRRNNTPWYNRIIIP